MSRRPVDRSVVMDIKRTLAISLVFHTCFLIAAFFLSVNFAGEGGRKSYDKALFVRLVRHIGEPDNEHIIETKLHSSKSFRPPLLKADNENNPPSPPLLAFARKQGGMGGFSDEKLSVEKIDFQNEIVSNERTTENGNNYGPDLYSEGFPVNVSSQEHGSMGIITADNNPASHPLSSEGIAADNGRVLSQATIDIIRDSIEKVKIYPIFARKRGIEGTVYVSFRVNLEGKPQNILILNSSGSNILDTATMDIVKRAAPFPYVDIPLEVPVVFRLD